jgi:tetratricopeptide (TPR) repeat protein
MKDGIRISNKILILLLIIIFAFMVYHLSAVLQDKIDTFNDPWMDFQPVFYQGLIKQYPGTEKIADMLKSADDLYPVIRNSLDLDGLSSTDYYTSPSGAYNLKDGWARMGKGLDQARLEQQSNESRQKIEIYQEIIELHPGPPWGDIAKMKLGYALFSLGRLQEAISALEPLMGFLDRPWMEVFVPVKLSQAYIRLGRLEEAEQTLLNALEFSKAPYLKYYLAYVWQREGQLKKAADLFLELSKNKNQQISYASRYLREKALMLTKPTGSVQGRVTLNNQGLQGVRVYVLHDIPKEVWSIPPDIVGDGYTNEYGEYQIWGIPPGRYQLVLHVPMDVLAGTLVQFETPVVKIEAGCSITSNVFFERTPRILQVDLEEREAESVLSISWEKDPRAQAYNLLFGVYDEKGNVFYLDTVDGLPTKETSVQVFLGQDFTKPFLSSVPPEDGFNLAVLFGVRLPGATLKIQVIPLDEKGKPFLSSSSVWQVPIQDPDPSVVKITLPNYALTEADSLLIEGEYQEAVKAYEKLIGDKPEDVYSMQILAYLYRQGIDSQGTHKDLKRAQEICSMLSESGGLICQGTVEEEKRDEI